MPAQDIVVIGGGLVGITTAYELQARGHRTTLIEAREGVALETSRANGSMLTPSMADPWNAPGVHRHLAASLFDPGAAMKLRLAAVPSLAGWGIQFLRNSSAVRHAAASRASFVLAHYSVARTRELRERLGLAYDAATLGTIKVFREPAAMRGPLEVAGSLEPLGLRFEVLDAEATVAAEPALGDIRGKIAGALRFPGDETGDAHVFCQALAAAYEKAGGILRRSTRVLALRAERAASRALRSRRVPSRRRA